MQNRRSLENISDMFKETPKPKRIVEFKARSKNKPVKLGATCNKCHTKKSLTGICFCNF